MYPFVLYHRMMSYKYKFSKTETLIYLEAIGPSL